MTELPLTSQTFLDQLTGHEMDAWSLFSEIYGAAIYEFCIRRGLQDSEANDVRQDVLIAVEKQLALGRHDSAKGSFRGWIFGVTKNLINQSIRQRNRMIATGNSDFRKVLGELESPQSEDAAEFELNYRRQLFNWATELVKRRVNETSWQAFWKTTIEDESTSVVAQDLKMSIGAVYTAKCRVLAQLQKLLKNLPDDFHVDQTAEGDVKHQSPLNETTDPIQKNGNSQ